MKNKTKLVLGLSILTAAALTAGATGTFAWFTTNRKATATFQNITAQSVEGSLTITMGTLTAAVSEVKGSLDKDVSATIASASSTTDVSSQDGLTFARPNWVSNITDDTISGIADVSKVQDYGKKGYWSAYYVGLKNGGGKDADVYLDINSLVSAHTLENPKDLNAAKWTRVAINVFGDAQPSSTVETLKKADGTNTILLQNTDAGTHYVAPGTDVKYSTAVKDVSTTTYDGANTLKDVVAASSTDDIVNQKIVTIASTKTKYLVVSVWLEGTATGTTSNQDDAIGGVVDVKLNFAARTVAAA